MQLLRRLKGHPEPRVMVGAALPACDRVRPCLSKVRKSVVYVAKFFNHLSQIFLALA